MKSLVIFIVVCISVYLTESKEEEHYSKIPLVIGYDGGPERRFLKDVLKDMAYMFFLTTKCRVTMKDRYNVYHPACAEYLTLCGMTSRMFYVNDELGKNHPDVPKQLPLLSYDQPDEVDVEKATIQKDECQTQEDKARTVLGGVNVLDKYIEHIKNRSRSFESKHKPIQDTDLSTYLTDIQEMETLFPKGSLEETENPDTICSETKCRCLANIYMKLMKLNLQLKHLWNDGLKLLIQ